MRSMPRPGPALFSRPSSTDPKAVAWQWRTKVYPDTLAVRPLGAPWPTFRHHDSDSRVEVARWQILGVGVYSAYALIGSGERLTTAVDGVLLDKAVEQDADDHTGSIAAFLGAESFRDTEAYRTILRKIMCDTVRGVMCCWANTFPPENRDWRDEFLGTLVNVGHFIVGAELPIGMNDGCLDMRKFVPRPGF